MKLLGRTRSERQHTEILSLLDGAGIPHRVGAPAAPDEEEGGRAIFVAEDRLEEAVGVWRALEERRLAAAREGGEVCPLCGSLEIREVTYREAAYLWIFLSVVTAGLFLAVLLLFPRVFMSPRRKMQCVACGRKWDFADGGPGR